VAHARGEAADLTPVDLRARHVHPTLARPQNQPVVADADAVRSEDLFLVSNDTCVRG